MHNYLPLINQSIVKPIITNPVIFQHDNAMWIFGGMTDLQERSDFWRFDFGKIFHYQIWQDVIVAAFVCIFKAHFWSAIYVTESVFWLEQDH